MKRKLFVGYQSNTHSCQENKANMLYQRKFTESISFESLLPVTNVCFSRKFILRKLLQNGFLQFMAILLSWKIAGNQLRRHYLILQEAVNDILGSRESVKKNIVNLPPDQGESYATDVEVDDEDVFHRNDLLPNDVQVL